MICSNMRMLLFVSLEEKVECLLLIFSLMFFAFSRSKSNLFSSVNSFANVWALSRTVTMNINNGSSETGILSDPLSIPFSSQTNCSSCLIIHSSSLASAIHLVGPFFNKKSNKSKVFIVSDHSLAHLPNN